jgi:serine/threonine protein kinase
LPKFGTFPGELQEGDLIGGTCTVLDYIGRGAMGHVYRVRHNSLNSEYALKMLSRDQFNEEATRLFKRESYATTKLSHPNIVRIYESGLHDDKLPYYAMELLAGRDLGKKIRDTGPLPLTDAAAIFIEVCKGLSYAHSTGVIHLDIKPSNIFLLDKPGASREKVKVVDFGIVKFTRAKDLENPEGDVQGTPFYMSPEQCTGGRVDARSDIYSLGCALFEALTGRLPFCGANPSETMHMQVRDLAPTLSSASDGKEFPGAMEAVIAKALAKKPAERYQTMDEMSQALAGVVENEKWAKAMADGPTAVVKVTGPITYWASLSQEKKSVLVIVALAVLMIVLCLVFFLMSRH